MLLIHPSAIRYSATIINHPPIDINLSYTIGKKRKTVIYAEVINLLSTAYVYLNLLQESQELISAIRHLLRASRNF